MFCDISTPQAKAPASKAAKTLDNPLLHALEGAVPLPEQEPTFTVYDDIRQKLIAQGMPADQIVQRYRKNFCQCLQNQIGWIYFSFFYFCNLLDRYMAQIRKFLLCQVFFLSGFPHFLPQSGQIINRHNRSPQIYSIVLICTKE